jgi:transcriptional regulator with XRE-family HTH domain
MDESFGIWLARKLEENRFSRLEFSRQVGVSHAAVDFWVNGQTIPRPRNCKEIARVLNVPYQEIMRLAGHLPFDDYPPLNENAARIAIDTYNTIAREAGDSTLLNPYVLGPTDRKLWELWRELPESARQRVIEVVETMSREVGMPPER